MPQDKISKNPEMRQFFETYHVQIFRFWIYIALTAYASYDVYLLVDDYLNDNRVTQTQVKLANQNTSFVQDALFYLRMSDNSILDDYWEMDATEFYNIYKLTPSIEQLQQALADMEYATASNASAHLTVLGKVFDLLNWFDYAALQRMANATVEWEDARRYYGKPVYTSVINWLLTNYKQYQSLIEATLLKFVDSVFKITNTAQKQYKPYFYVDEFTIFKLKFAVRVNDHVSVKGLKSTSYISYDVGSVEWPKLKVQNLTLSLNIYFPHNSLKVSDTASIQCDGRTSMAVSINISNKIVHNKTGLKACDDVPTEFDCAQYCQIQYIVKICECIPFIYRRMFQSMMYKLPFCTFDRYDSCLSEAYQTSRIPCSKPCDPCVTIKNNIMIEKRDWPLGQGSRPLTVRVALYDPSYILFEEKQQNTRTQLISQIGGDLGLFTGFTCLTFFELVSWLYHRLLRKKVAPCDTMDSGDVVHGPAGPVFVVKKQQLVAPSANSTQQHDHIKNETRIDILERKLIAHDKLLQKIMIENEKMMKNHIRF